MKVKKKKKGTLNMKSSIYHYCLKISNYFLSEEYNRLYCCITESHVF